MAFNPQAVRQQLAESEAAAGAAAADFLRANSAPGVAYGVVHNGQLVFAGGAGQARLDGSAPDGDSIFRIASMTKSFTAAAILQLRDAGLLALDSPMSDYVPELAALSLPSHSRMPTVRDLLTMQGGWATDDPWADRQESMSAAEFSTMLATGFAFNDAPGTQFEYSNLGYTILGRIITNVSGQQYQDYVSSKILAPLGMGNTGFTLQSVDASQLADGHFRRDDQWHVEPVAATGEFAALGGLFSSVADLSRWVGFMCAAFAGEAAGSIASLDVEAGWDAVLRPDSRRLMQQGHRHVFSNVSVDLSSPALPLVAGSPMYGFGLMNMPSPRFGATVGHSGGYPGYGTHMVWHPVTGTGVIALSNGRYGGAFRLATQVLRDLLLKVEAPSRVVRPTSDTKKSFIAVNRLLVEWDDAVADALFSPNVDEDEPREHRKASIAEQLAKVGGITGAAEEISSTASSHMAWWLAGASGRLRAEIRLNPVRVQQVQTLNVRAVPTPSAALLSAANEVVASLHSSGTWPADIAVADGLDLQPLLKAAAVMRAMETSVTLARNPVSADSPTSATLRIHGTAMRYDLTLALDDAAAVSKASLAMVPLTSDDNTLLVL